MKRCEPGSTHAVGQITTTATVFIDIGNSGRRPALQYYNITDTTTKKHAKNLVVSEFFRTFATDKGRSVKGGDSHVM